MFDIDFPCYEYETSPYSAADSIEDSSVKCSGLGQVNESLTLNPKNLKTMRLF